MLFRMMIYLNLPLFLLSMSFQFLNRVFRETDPDDRSERKIEFRSRYVPWKNPLTLDLLPDSVDIGSLACEGMAGEEGESTKFAEMSRGCSRIPGESMLANLCRCLSEREAVLEYFTCDDVLFILVLTTRRRELFHVRVGQGFEEEIMGFQHALMKADMQGYLGKGHALFERLIRPVRLSIAGFRRLHIITQRSLGTIPFELLPDVSEEKCDPCCPLIRRFDIAYHMSLQGFLQSRLSCDMTGSDGSSCTSFLGYTPFNPGGREAFDIRFTFDEVSGIVEGFRDHGKQALMISGDITPGKLRRYMRRYGIVHLATHSRVMTVSHNVSGFLLSGGEDDPFPPDTSRFLSLCDFPRLHLDCNLLVLSCCTLAGSGPGQDCRPHCVPEELFRSGAKNVIFSLWNVTDRYTSRLMLRFYRYCLEGSDYASALRRAKLDLLDDPFTSAPWIWGGFILCSS